MDKTNRDIQLGQKSLYVEKIEKGGRLNVTYAGERRIPHALTSPPFLTEIFLGRQDDLQLIHDKLFAPGSNLLLLVNGEGGIGKTTLAAKYYHTYQHEYIHVAWVLSEKSIASALLLLAVPLGLQFAERQDTGERLEVLLTALMNLEKPCLLVIDNANELADLDANYQRLRRCSNFHLLLTTRITHFERAEACAINGLPKDEALELFERYYRGLDDGEKALFFQIREAVGGNTLVLELLAKNLAGQNRLKQRYSLANLLADLQSLGLLQLSHSQAVGTDYQSKDSMRRETPEAIVSAMYDLSGLPSEESALLSVFAVLPVESIAFATLETLLPGLPELDSHLLSLAQKGWIEYNEATISFKCSPVVQEVTRQKNPSLREHCAMLVNTLIEKLACEGTHITGSSYNDALRYARYAEAVIRTFSKSADDSLAILSERTGNYHRIIGNLERSLFFFTQFHQLAKELFDADPQNKRFKDHLAISCQFLGDTHTALGHLDQALAFFSQYHQLEKELFDTYPQNVDFKNGLAISCQFLGDTHAALGHLDLASTFFTQFQQLAKELVAADPQNVGFKNNLAISCQYLGETHTALGNLDLALTFFAQFNQLAKELFDAYPENVEFKKNLAISCQFLGNTHNALGNLDRTLTFFEQYHQLAKELVDDYPQNVDFKYGLALSYQCLGSFYEDQLEDLNQAQKYYHQSKKLLLELVSRFPGYVEFEQNLDWVTNKLPDEPY